MLQGLSILSLRPHCLYMMFPLAWAEPGPERPRSHRGILFGGNNTLFTPGQTARGARVVLPGRVDICSLGESLQALRPFNLPLCREIPQLPALQSALGYLHRKKKTKNIYQSCMQA